MIIWLLTLEALVMSVALSNIRSSPVLSFGAAVMLRVSANPCPRVILLRLFLSN